MYDIKLLFKVNILNLYCIFLYVASMLEVWKHCFISTFPRKWMENFSLFKQNRHFFTQLNSLSLSIYWYPFILQTEKFWMLEKKILIWVLACEQGYIHSFFPSIQTWDANIFIVWTCIKLQQRVSKPQWTWTERCEDDSYVEKHNKSKQNVFSMSIGQQQSIQGLLRKLTEQ